MSPNNYPKSLSKKCEICGIKRKIVLTLIAVWMGLGYSRFSLADDYIHVAALMDLRTQVSDGAHSLEDLARIARERGFDVLFINDHDRMALEYGIWPLRDILKKKVEKPSINKLGAEKYLKMIESASKKFPKMIFIPGAESAPFYYWEGSYFKKNLTVCDWERHLLIVGLDKPEDYRDLPVLYGGYSIKKPFQSVSVGIFLFLIPLALGFAMMKRGGKTRYLGLAVLALTTLLVALSSLTFRSSIYDPYHGSRGLAPYQQVIDYVDSRGGMVFWNHPETRSGLGTMGPVEKRTLPYPEVLAGSKNYAGFAALYGDTITVTEPGNIWDQVLTEYCSGRRGKPVWGISAADFHEDGGTGEKLGKFPTVFLVKNKTKESILDALKKGRMYAFQGSVDIPRLVLEDFSILDTETLHKGIMGEEISVNGYPTVNILITVAGSAEKNPVTVRLIRSGKLLKTISGDTPLRMNFKDEFCELGKKIFYRLDAADRKGRKLVSNPVFVKFPPGKD
jgi:hypothetical protein